MPQGPRRLRVSSSENAVGPSPPNSSGTLGADAICQRVRAALGASFAGETRELTIALLPLRSGQLSADFQVPSQSHALQRVAAGAEVDPRVVELALAGPRRRSPGQRAEFLLTVRNTSSQDLPEARVDVEFDPATLAVREASIGSESGTGSLAWPLGALLKGERVQIQIEYECLAESLRSPEFHFRS